MTKQEKIEFMKQLQEAGVFMALHVPAVGGGKTIGCTCTEILDYLDDPLAFTAKHYGISIEDYTAWSDCRGELSCSGFTKAGKPCKGYIGGSLEPAEWSRQSKKENYCHHHGPTVYVNKEIIG